MNDQQPYEKHLADKLHQLPVPDVEPKWQQMKALLDKEMPRGGGYWRWITGTGIMLLLITGVWLITNQKGDDGIAVNTKKPAGVAKTIPGNGSAEKKATPGNDENRMERSGNPPVNSSTTEIQTGQAFNGSSNTTRIEENLLSKKEVSKSSSSPDLPANPTGSRLSTPVTRNPSGVKNPGTNEVQSRPANAKLNRAQPPSTPSGYANGSNTIVNEIPEKTPSRSSSVPAAVLKEDKFSKPSVVYFNPRSGIMELSVIDAVAPTIDQQAYSKAAKANIRNVSPAEKAAAIKQWKAKNLLAGENRNVAIGLSLPLGFPLGDQKPGPYNINAQPNTASDFLPVPHVQYHLNNQVYLQTELQMMNPQFIQPVLLFQDARAVPSANTMYVNSVYAQKLYYFNIPVGIHYSPFRHFFLGTGLQFSSLISGVALSEETSSVIGSGRSTVISQEYSKFKDDSLSQKMDNSEFRLMLDANYYWKKFTVGLRYNQAFSNYVTVRVNVLNPLVQDKNKSLQFYLRYNLWENQKRKW